VILSYILATRHNHILGLLCFTSRQNSVLAFNRVSVFLFMVFIFSESRDSSGGIALGYGLDDWGSRVLFSAGAGNFSFHHRVQKGSGAQPTSYPIGTRGSFPAGKVAVA
jgi:hypothetical protein